MRTVFAAGLLIGGGLLWAPCAQAQDVLDQTFFTPTQPCTGPLGSMLPDCQGKSGAEAKPNLKGAGDAIGTSNLKIPAMKPETPTQSAPEAAPQPPTEFQRFVSTTVGQMLPIFGASLFEKAPTTFAPVDRVPVTADYVVGPGDEIVLRAWGQVNMNLELGVDRSGAIFIPQVGNVSVAGVRFQQLGGYMRSQLERVYRNFDLTVNMGQLRSIQILVVGQARRPGTYTVSSLSTLVNALFASGGPSSQGSMRRIQLKRGAHTVTEFDLYDLLLKGDKSRDARLLPGDVLYIPPAGPQVALAGSVKGPAVYELNGEKTAGDVVQMAGGLSAMADAQRAVLERIERRSSRRTLEFQLDEAGLAMPVRDGDVMHVLPIQPRFANAVTLRGNVANPGRFPWHEGMRLHEVIPNKESLITRDYWRKQNLMGFLPPEETAAVMQTAEARHKPAQAGSENPVPEINWSYAAIERQNPKDLRTEPIPFHPGKLILEHDSSQDLALLPGDVVTIYSQAEIRVPLSQQNRLIRLEGEFTAAGIYAARTGETLGQLVERSGGLTPQAYLFGAEFMRESTRNDQQRRLDQFIRDLEQEIEQAATHRLSAATQEESTAVAAKLESERRLIEKLRTVKATGRIVLNLDPDDTGVAKLMDLPLEDGDRFLVPARPSTVNVLGAVYNQNAFLHDPRLRVADYLRQAGGETRGADKGREFVIRADGSVLPKQSFSAFGHSFESTRLNPGDTVVAPEAMFKGSVLRALRDWTQIFAQLALGAAAINVLR